MWRKVDFQSRISKSVAHDTKSTSVFKSHLKVRFTRQLKSTSVFKSHLKVRSARHKVDFGFQVAFLSPHCRHLKSTLVACKVRFDGTATSQAPRLDAKLLLGISPSRGLHSTYYSRITSACFARSQARGLRTNNYSTWLIRLSYLGGYTLQEYSSDGFREH
jgi:hypothetical protein